MCWVGLVGILMAIGGWSLLKDGSQIGLVNLLGFFIIVTSLLFMGMGVLGLVALFSQ